MQNHCPGKAGEAGMYISNSNALRGGIVSPRDRNFYSRSLPAHSRDGRDCRLVYMMAGAIKSVEGSLPEKYQSGQHYQGTTLHVRNPAVRFSSDFSAWRFSDPNLLACEELEVLDLQFNGLIFCLAYFLFHG